MVAINQTTPKPDSDEITKTVKITTVVNEDEPIVINVNTDDTTLKNAIKSQVLNSIQDATNQDPIFTNTIDEGVIRQNSTVIVQVITSDSNGGIEKIFNNNQTRHRKEPKSQWRNHCNY